MLYHFVRAMLGSRKKSAVPSIAAYAHRSIKIIIRTIVCQASTAKDGLLCRYSYIQPMPQLACIMPEVLFFNIKTYKQ
jgi:hypothetical protein